MHSFEVLKSRINEIYRCHTLLESYENNLLRGSEFKPEHHKDIEAAKERCIALAQEILSTISAITKSEYKVNSFIRPIEVSYDLIKSEHFFEARELIDGLLSVYEKNFNSLVDKFMIGPLDKLRFYKMQFV